MVNISDKVARATLFAVLTVWMVLAGTLLLETVTNSLGMGAFASPETLAPGVHPGWERLFLAYRYAVSLISLFCGYHAFSGREWARKGILTLIVVDLTGWVVSSFQTFLTTGGFGLDRSRMFLQVFVVLFEAGLFRLLLDDHIIGGFHRLQKNVPSAEK